MSACRFDNGTKQMQRMCVLGEIGILASKHLQALQVSRMFVLPCSTRNTLKMGSDLRRCDLVQKVRGVC